MIYLIFYGENITEFNLVDNINQHHTFIHFLHPFKAIVNMLMFKYSVRSMCTDNSCKEQNINKTTQGRKEMH